MDGFFPIDNNILINVKEIDSVEQRNGIDGLPIVYVNIGGKEYEVKRDVKGFLDMIHNIGESDTYWSGR